MKNLKTTLSAVILTAAFSLINNAGAHYKPTGEDGITASPKVRLMLDQRAATARKLESRPGSMVTQVPGSSDIAASPRVRQMLAEHGAPTSVVATPELASAGYQPTGADGVTASPKLREQLNQRSSEPIMIAPVK